MLSGIDHLGWFITAGFLLNLTPGPDVLYIVSQALKTGLRAGAAAALGITAGCFLHVAAATLGVSAVLAVSGTAFTLVKWLGAGYLLVVGWGMLGLRSSGTSKETRIAPELIAAKDRLTGLKGHYDLWHVFRNGFWTNVLNPKVALFFLAFLPQFIAPGAAHPSRSFLLLGLIFVANGLWVCMGYAALAAALSRRLAAVQQGVHWLERAAGLMFMGFGVKLALSDNPAFQH